jgi:hypothetical protein
MPRSSRTSELVSNLEVERTARTNRKGKRQEKNLLTLTLSTSNSKNKRKVEISENMVEHRILKELATPNMN